MSLEAELAEMLAELPATDRDNQTSVEDVRQSLRELLDEPLEQNEFGDVVGWNLTMRDGNPTEDATFVAYTIDSEICFVAGRGNPYQVREVIGDIVDATELFEELADWPEKLQLAQRRVRCPRSVGESWSKH